MGYDENLQGKATLAAEDIRFARTIDRIQRIILSELYKIALIHLYVQGYEGDNLVNFELSLTTPSIIYDQERIALMKEKVDLAGSILEKKILPSDWIYDNIFHLSEDQYDEYRDLVIQDQKRAFRFKQIENEGNDPAESGRSYGTPHDLAYLYGKGRYASNSENVPDGYGEDVKLGRPQERASSINTQNDPLGRDRLGVNDMKHDDQPGLKSSFKGGSPFALESTRTEFLKNKTILEEAKKQIAFKKEDKKESLLDESKIKE
jgi:hypothetical protein